MTAGSQHLVLCAHVGILTLAPEKLARDVELLAPHNDNLLAVEKLLRDGAGQAAEQVALAIDDNNRLESAHV